MPNYYAVSESLDGGENVCNTFAFAFGTERARDEWVAQPTGEPDEFGGHWRRRALDADKAELLIECIGCTLKDGAVRTEAMDSFDEYESRCEEQDAFGEDY